MFLSWRYILILAIGLIAGAMLGIGYFFISPLLSNAGSKSWQSQVKIHVINPSGSHMSLVQLQNTGQDFAAKANTLSFLQFLSQELAKQTPADARSVDELSRMVTIAYGNTPVVEVKANAPTAEETKLLITRTPELLTSYLTAEENEKQQKDNQNILKTIEAVTTELQKAQQEADNLKKQMVSSDIHNDSNYIALNARVKALGLQLESQATDLSALTAIGNVGEYVNMRQQDYQKTLEQAKAVSAALYQAQQEVQTLELKRSDISKDTTSITLNAKIKALQEEIDKIMVGYTVLNGPTQTHVVGLAEMIANGDTTSATYLSMLKIVETASAAIAEARRELSSLETQATSNGLTADFDYQLAQAKVAELNTELSVLREKLTLLARQNVDVGNQPDTQAAFERTSAALADAKKNIAILESQGSDSSSAKAFDYQLAQSKIDNLNKQLANLNNMLASSFANTNTTLGPADYLSVGKPDIPAPALPVRLSTALIIGIIFGIGSAWVVLNYKWLVKILISPQKEEAQD